MNKILLSVAALTLATALSPAIAQDTGLGNLEFSTADSDKSGGVSMAELELALPGIDDQRFKLADIDGDGFLSEEEYATFAAAQNANDTGLTTNEQGMSGDDTDPTNGEEPAPAN